MNVSRLCRPHLPCSKGDSVLIAVPFCVTVNFFLALMNALVIMLMGVLHLEYLEYTHLLHLLPLSLMAVTCVP